MKALSTTLTVGAAWLVGAAGPAARAAYVDAVDALNPAAYYRFGETSGATAADANLDGVAGAYDATYGTALSNTDKAALGPTPPAYPGFEADNSGQALKNAAGGGLTIPVPFNAAVLDAAITGGVTFQTWVRTTSTADRTLFSSRGNTGATNDLFNLEFLGTTDAVRVFARDGGTNLTYTGLASANVNDGLDHQLTFVVDVAGADRGVSIYLDGVALPVTIGGNATAIADGAFAGAFAPLIGAVYSTSAGDAGAYFAGTIDEFAVYDRELTATEVQSTFAAAVPEPTSLALFAAAAPVALRRRRQIG